MPDGQSQEGAPGFTALAVASGKGGVGKTLLSVALAYELSQNAKTLIIDLDFFNRGLTGLLRAGRVVKALRAPEILADLMAAQQAPAGAGDATPLASAASGEESADWELVEISENLFNIRYPDLSTDDYARIENTPIDGLVEDWSRYIAYVAKECGAHFVVLDCHGGPDRTSFAACKIAKTTLLVSEPDRITLYGTLNFLRQLEDIGGSEKHDIRLVLNKVVSSFNAPFLLRFYNQEIRREFGNKPLLAMFPLEEYLTKAFEKNALLAKVYPESQLARKTRVYIHDLLADSDSDHLSDYIKRMTTSGCNLARTTLGREFILLNNDFAIAMVFSIAMILMAATVAVEFGGSYMSLETEQILGDFVGVFTNTPIFATIALLWFVLTLLRTWIRRLTRTAIFLARTGSQLRSILAALAKAITVAPLVALGGGFAVQLFDTLMWGYDGGFYDTMTASDNVPMVAVVIFSAAYLAEYFFYNLRRATPFRRYKQVRLAERVANGIAIAVPLLIGVPFWFVS